LSYRRHEFAERSRRSQQLQQASLEQQKILRETYEKYPPHLYRVAIKGNQIEVTTRGGAPPPTETTPSWRETTATGSILEKGYAWKSGTKLHSGPKIYEMPPEQQERVLKTTRPVREVGAGFVSVAESWGGFFGRPTPPDPFSGVFGLATGRPEAWEAYLETPLLYKVGQVPAYVLETAVMSVGMGLAWRGAKKVTPKFIKEPVSRGVKTVTEPVVKTVKFSRVAKWSHKASSAIKSRIPSWKGSRVEMFFVKHSGRYAKFAGKGITRGEVAIPYITEPIGMAKLKASMSAW